MFSGSTPFASHVLEVGGAQNNSFVVTSAAAPATGQKVFEVETWGGA